MTGQSETPLLQKLGIKEGTRMTAVNAPADFRSNLGELPLAVEWANRVRPPLDIVIAFHTRRATLVGHLSTLTAAMVADGAIWVAWPKKASGMATDIDEEVLREAFHAAGWIDNLACAIDDTWSGMRFVVRKERRARKTAPAAKPARLRKTKPGSHR